jgi:hypothetical protein
VLYGGAGIDKFVIDSLRGYDTIMDFTSKGEKIAFSKLGIGGVGNGDLVVNGAMVRKAPGGFSKSAELVEFSQLISGEIDAAKAATVIGSATGSYGMHDHRLFVVTNGAKSNIYLFDSADTNATVSAEELTLIGVVNGKLPALSDFIFTT